MVRILRPRRRSEVCAPFRLLGEALRKAFLRGVLIAELASAAAAGAAICLWIRD